MPANAIAPASFLHWPHSSPFWSQTHVYLGVSLVTVFVLGALTDRFFVSHLRNVPRSLRGRGFAAQGGSKNDTNVRSPDQADAVYSPKKPMKMVFVVRTDLNMGKGKIAAQCCHACLAVYEQALTMSPKAVRAWKLQGQTKVAVKCDSEKEMLDIEDKAISLGLPAESILDAGRTQILAGSRTVLAIGPAHSDVVDEVTGHLKLL